MRFPLGSLREKSRRGWRPARRLRPAAAYRPVLEPLEDRTLPSGNPLLALPLLPLPALPLAPIAAESEPNNTLATANTILANGVTTGTITSPTDVDFYQVTLDQPGRLVALVHPLAAGNPTRLSFFNPTGNLLVQSDGQSASNADDLIDQYVDIGSSPETFYLEVQGQGGSTGNYTLTTAFVAGSFPFPPSRPNPVGLNPTALVSADFNGDGRLDVATGNGGANSVSVLLGQGDGTFQGASTIDVGGAPAALVVGDFNRDGRPDLAVVHQGPNDRSGQPTWQVAILLGNGDGTFQLQAQQFEVGQQPMAIVAADFNGDGRLDLAVANAGSNNVSILLGNGDGTFRAGPRATIAVGTQPTALVAADFTADQHVDLAVANAGSNDVSILLGDGLGGFQATAATLPVLASPSAIVAGHFTSSGFLDLAVANANGNPDGSNDGSVSVLLGNGDGTFKDQVEYVVGSHPTALAVGDFTADGRADLVTANGGSGDVTLLQGASDGTFQDLLSRTVGGMPAALAVGDFNGDNTPDLAVSNTATNNVQVLLDRDPTAPVPDLADPIVGTTVQSTPLLADLSGDGTNDSVIVTDAGQILLRLGRPGQPGSFAPPVPVNPLNRPARAITTVRAGSQTLLAAIDQFGDTVSLYGIARDGTAVPRGQLPTDRGGLATRIVTGRFRGVDDGFGDLMVLNALSRRVSTFLSDGQGGFLPPITTDFDGNGPFDLVAADLNGDGAADAVITNQVSGDLTVLLNNGNGEDFAVERYRAGRGPYGLRADGMTAVAGEGTSGVVVGDFTGDGRPDLLAINATARTIALLVNRGDGGFLNPFAFALGFSPALITAGQFTGSQNPPDVAILDAATQTIHVYLGDGRGGLSEMVSLDAMGLPAPLQAGNAPTGLAVHDVLGTGMADLQVGNVFGDVLTLLGNGDGTFRPFQRIDQNIALAVAVGQNFILSDQARDRVVLQQGLGGPVGVVQDRSNGILAPGQARIATVAGTQYVVIADSGANSVLVYRLINGQPDPASRQTYFVGADPVGITIADVNQNNVPDVVVANQGSNDVSILLGRVQGGNWTLTPGPRLQSGGVGPVATAVTDVNGDNIPDILVSNRQSGTVALLPGVGQGFFNDQSPLTRPAGDLPGTLVPVGHGVLAVNAGSNDLTFFTNFLSGASTTIVSGGLTPDAALAVDRSGQGVPDALVIANNGDATLALLLADGGTFRLAGVLSTSDQLRPTDLALAGLESNAVDVYMTAEGQEAVFRFSLEFGVAVGQPGMSSADLGTRPIVTMLVPLDELSLAIVVTLVTGLADQGPPLLEVSFAGGYTPGGQIAGASTSGAGSVIGGALTVVGEESYQIVLTQESARNVMEGQAVSDFVNGIDRALERGRHEAQQRWQQYFGQPSAESNPLPIPNQVPRDKPEDIDVRAPALNLWLTAPLPLTPTSLPAGEKSEETARGPVRAAAAHEPSGRAGSSDEEHAQRVSVVPGLCAEIAGDPRPAGLRNSRGASLAEPGFTQWPIEWGEAATSSGPSACSGAPKPAAPWWALSLSAVMGLLTIYPPRRLVRPADPRTKTSSKLLCRKHSIGS